jgi:hypothetical protein
MPAPVAVSIQNQLKQALLDKGFTKKTYVDGAIVSDKTSLPDALQSLVDAWGNGDAKWFADWQTAQKVLIPSTSPVTTPSTGILP